MDEYLLILEVSHLSKKTFYLKITILKLFLTIKKEINEKKNTFECFN